MNITKESDDMGVPSPDIIIDIWFPQDNGEPTEYRFFTQKDADNFIKGFKEGIESTGELENVKWKFRSDK